MRRVARRLLWVCLVLLLVVVGGAALWIVQQLRASLPMRDGELELPGLSAPVTIERDAQGVPTIRAADRVDASRALGFLHAQERFFQMDLLRRSAAGELAALFGPTALDYDRRIRVHRFRARAGQVLDLLPAADRALLEAYVAGVNAGLAALDASPFEYLLLRAEPEPWRAADTLLTGYAMYLDLQDEDGALDSTRGLLWDKLPAPVAAFLDPPGTLWDAPLVGRAYAQPPVPASALFDLRALPPADEELSDGQSVLAEGSNAWAVAGSLTAHGGALLASDMHLGLRVPNVWYRAVLRYPDMTGGERRVVGVTLPGAPLVAVGSNGRLAWGLTNSYGDWSDLVVLEPASEEAYWTYAGPWPYRRYDETIAVRGGTPEILEVRETRWGPVIDHDYRGRPRALRWVAHTPQAIDLGLLRLEATDSVAAALPIAARFGVPAQNIVLADSDGHIGWTIAGPVPLRYGCDNQRPLSWRATARCGSGWLAPAGYPRVVDPPGGRIWSANARVVDGVAATLLGDGGYALGARARQIRDALRARTRFDEPAMLAVQLDDRALFLQRWRKLLLDTLDPPALAGHPQRAELRRLAADWDGRADIDAVGYRMVRRFRETVAGAVFAPLNDWLGRFDERFDYGRFRQREGPLWALVTQRPAHWLNAYYPDWRTLLLAAADDVIDALSASGPLAERTWGERNTLAMHHPLSRALPLLGRWLDMPAEPLPGGIYMPRVQGTDKGASERLVVAPGNENRGIFHMPGGQSGHPLSPDYRAGHEAWVRGDPTPLLPGPTQHQLRLLPAHQE